MSTNMQMIGPVFVTVILGIVINPSATAQHIPRKNTTYPRRICEIPNAHYQIDDRSRSQIALSKRFVYFDDLEELVRQQANLPTEDNSIGRDIKLFQWDQGSLQIDHCSISNMALQLKRNGEWVLSLRADQNPDVESDSATMFNPNLHIKRNRFAVRLRCYGNISVSPATTGSAAGRPVLAAIEFNEFWVQNGQPRFLLASFSDGWIAQNFELIERVQIEFYYVK